MGAQTSVPKPEHLEQSRGPDLQDRTPEPKGVIRRNLKMQVYLGIAVLFIVATALSSLRHKPASKAAQPGQPPDPVVQESTASIEEMRRNLEKQQHERAPASMNNDTLAPRVPYSSGNASDPSAPYSTGAMSGGYNCTPGQPCPTQTGYSPYQQQRSAAQQERLQLEQQERALAYKARFASNLAYSQSRGIAGPSSLVATNQSDPNAYPGVGTGSPSSIFPSTRYFPAQFGNADPSVQLSNLLPPDPPQQAQNSTAPEANYKRPAEVNVNAATGQPYVVYEGTIIEAALMNRLDGDASGPVKVLVTNLVYSHDQQHVLIPEGTVVLGETHKIGNTGFGQQRRLAVVFHRMIMPDGYAVDLDQFVGLNQIGETGLKDKVNNHYLEIFGTSIALGVIAGAAEISSPGGVVTGNGTDAFKYGAASGVSQSATTILDRFINIPPTITIRDGHRVKVYISQDLLLPAYDSHTIPPTF
jgi:type IV secretion system protein VirB10